MERFEYISDLGAGAYGVVWLCVDRETNQKVAMKRFKDAHTDPEVMRLALREVRMLKAAQHPNVVRMLEAFRSKSGRVYIAMEYVERTLTHDLRKFHGKGFPPLLAKMITWQLLQATRHLHSIQMMHRDIKPANILLSADYELKLCDFGFARNLRPREVAEYTTYVVTRWYRAPEILVSDAYGPKVDVWAIGCLLAEMVGGRPLFPGKSSADQMWLTIRTLGDLPGNQAALMAGDSLYSGFSWPTAADRTSLGKRFPQFPPDLMDLLHSCLALDPDQRFNVEEALAHPYFDDVPELQETIAGTGCPAANFWARIEEAWLAAVAANGNDVSSPRWLQASKSHSRLDLLLQSDVDVFSSSNSCRSSDSSGTPNAPIRLLRRELTSRSLYNTGTGLLDSVNTIRGPSGPNSRQSDHGSLFASEDCFPRSVFHSRSGSTSQMVASRPVVQRRSQPGRSSAMRHASSGAVDSSPGGDSRGISPRSSCGAALSAPQSGLCRSRLASSHRIVQESQADDEPECSYSDDEEDEENQVSKLAEKLKSSWKGATSAHQQHNNGLPTAFATKPGATRSLRADSALDAGPLARARVAALQKAARQEAASLRHTSGGIRPTRSVPQPDPLPMDYKTSTPAIPVPKPFQGITSQRTGNADTRVSGALQATNHSAEEDPEDAEFTGFLSKLRCKIKSFLAVPPSLPAEKSGLAMPSAAATSKTVPAVQIGTSHLDAM